MVFFEIRVGLVKLDSQSFGKREAAMNEIMKLCDLVRETSFAIHCYHRSGHLEKIYENALVHRLRKSSLNVRQNHPVTV